MIYLARFTHLKYKPDYKAGDKIKRGDIIGTMGNTGFSTGAHLHFDLIQELAMGMYRLIDIPKYITDLGELMQQYLYFLDDELFGCPLKITTPFCEWAYYQKYKKWHYGYDLIPRDRKKTAIVWNRSANGTVQKGSTDNGYGNYIIVRYEG